jgi:glycosyltransferase involved in cell wall biosynthesis
MANSRLTIYIDGRSLLRPRDGIGTYTRTLLQNMLALDTHNKYVAVGFADQKNNDRLVAESANFTYYFLPIPRKIYMGLFRLWQMPVDAFLPSKPDVVWYPDFVMAPYVRSGKKVVTVADLTYITDADTVEPKNLRYLQRFVPQAIARADVVTTVSKAVAKQITHTYQPTAPVQVVYPAAPPETPGTPDSAHPYILFVSTLQPRKNVVALLNAYMLLPAELRQKYRLVLAGRKGWNDDVTQAAMAVTPHEWVDGPNDDELLTLYKGASLFVMPSLREGFGIPPVEALACHVPVITSTDPALVEGTGKAALHVDVSDPKNLADAMQSMLTDARLRQKLAAERPRELAKLDGKTIAQSFIATLTA